MPASADALLLAELPSWAFASALLFARIGAACMLLPGIGEAELPTMARIGFAVALCFLLLPLIGPTVPVMPGDPWTLARLVVAEIATGLLLGWLTRLTLLALGQAGQYIAALTGLSNVLQPDPTLGPQTAALGRLFMLAAPVALLSSGLFAAPIAALAGSYGVMPPGTGLPSHDTLRVAIAAVGGMFALALQLASPFVLADIVWQVALGVLARLVPQLQTYFAAMPGQIIGGLGLLALAAVAIVATWHEFAATQFAALPGAGGP